MLEIIREVGWGAPIVPVYDPKKDVDFKGGWGSGIEESTQPERHTIEIRVYADKVLAGTFRTDVPEVRQAIEAQAQDFLRQMKLKNPQINYTITS